MAVIQYGVFGFARQQGKLLYGGEDDAARFAFGQHLPQVVAVFGLNGGLPQQFLGVAECLEQLPIKVVAVGDHQQGWILHFGLLQEHPGITAHADAFARALSVPHNARFFTARFHRLSVGGPPFGHSILVDFFGGYNGGQHSLAHGMKLVIARQFLNQLPVVVLEQDKIAQVIEQTFPLEEAPDEYLQLPFQQGFVVFIGDGTPGSKPLLVGGERADAGCKAVANDQGFVVGEQVG